MSNLAYLDKIIRDADDQKKTIASVQFLAK